MAVKEMTFGLVSNEKPKVYEHKEWTINGWDQNYVLIRLRNGQYTCIDVLAHDPDWHRYPLKKTPREILEWIGANEGWNGGGDVNIQGRYVQWKFKGVEQTSRFDLKDSPFRP